MRFAVGGLLFEGNTFSPVIATRADFASKYLVEGDAVVARLTGTGTEVGGAIDEIGAARDEILPLIATHGGAGGRVATATTTALCEALLARIAALPPVDGIYLALHGAFVSQDSLDVDGDLLARVRGLRPTTPIVVSCDLHAHVTDAMLANCDALIGYKHYPHDDTYETGRRAVAMLRDMATGALKPALVACRIPMIAPAQNQRTRGTGPMVEVRALAESLAVGAIRDVSYFCVQPWIDAPALGWTVVVTANADGDRAAEVARAVAAAMWERRERSIVETVAPADAIRRGLATDGLVVLADASDCVGGGASGDSAIALDALLRHAPSARGAIHIADDVTACRALALQPGARLAVELGNRRDPAYGPPLAAEAVMLRAAPRHFTYAGGLMRGVEAELGDAAVLRIGGVDVLVSANACYEYADEAFAAAGIDVRAGKFVVVKNPMNYQQAYAEAAARFILDTPGPTTPNLAALPWRRIDRPIFPVDPATPGTPRLWRRGRGWTTS
ncbi:MAG: M81 family metallopeptidase [Alphaproteobacteria bacterium]|nr:M81 family metallopeptidase [Alphaproteobacteria bacterium]